MRSLSSAVARIIVPPSAFVSGVIGLAVAIPLLGAANGGPPARQRPKARDFRACESTHITVNLGMVIPGRRRTNGSITSSGRDGVRPLLARKALVRIESTVGLGSSVP